MRNLFLMMLLALSSAILQAGEKESNRGLFSCMDKQDFSQNGQCIEEKMNQKIAIADTAINYAELSEGLGGNALATMTFHPQDMHIQIVGHIDSNNALTAQVTD